MKLHQLTIAQASAMLRSKKVSSMELTEAAIGRIHDTEPRLHALLAQDFDGARSAAAAADEKISRGETLSPLAGIPCTIKDMLLTAGIETTAASAMLKGYVPVYDATVVGKLKGAGAVILAKNNCDAWAHGSSTENSDFGPTKNPWNTEHVPGGSSGGSAAAVAADQGMYSIGTDTGGSIRQPASLCGVVGLKPTYGRVSRFGAIAMASSLDCIGPVTKTVEDAAIVMNAIAGKDERDSTTLPREVPDYTSFLGLDLHGVRVGVVREAFGEGLSDETRAALETAQQTLRNLGATIVDVSLEYLEHGIATYYIIMPSEVSSNLGRYDGIRYGHASPSAKHLQEAYLQNRGEGFGREAKRRIMIGTYVLSAGYYDAYYKKAMQVRTLIRGDFDRAFTGADVLLMPTTPAAAFRFGEKSSDPLEMYLSDIYTVTLNMAGVPGLAVPAGFSKAGLPIGMQLVAPQFEEGRLLRVGHAFEQATEWHTRKPAL